MDTPASVLAARTAVAVVVSARDDAGETSRLLSPAEVGSAASRPKPPPPEVRRVKESVRRVKKSPLLRAGVPLCTAPSSTVPLSWLTFCP
eukprot:scaffold1117_cov32-Phaeocystis_antarctica.AAC.2